MGPPLCAAAAEGKPRSGSAGFLDPRQTGKKRGSRSAPSLNGEPVCLSYPTDGCRPQSVLFAGIPG